MPLYILDVLSAERCKKAQSRCKLVSNASGCSNLRSYFGMIEPLLNLYIATYHQSLSQRRD